MARPDEKALPLVGDVPDGEDVLTLAQAGRLLGVPPETVRGATKRGELPSWQTRASRCVRRKALLAWWARRQAGVDERHNAGWITAVGRAKVPGSMPRYAPWGGPEGG